MQILKKIDEVLDTRKFEVSEIASVRYSGKNLYIDIIFDGDVKSPFSLHFTHYNYLRMTDESYLIDEGKFDEDDKGNVLSEVHNSELISYFHKISCGITEGHDLRHFTIVTDEDCLDVISAEMPKFKN